MCRKHQDNRTSIGGIQRYSTRHRPRNDFHIGQQTYGRGSDWHLLPTSFTYGDSADTQHCRSRSLARHTIATVADIDEAAEEILKLGCKALLIKGGHIEGNEKTDRLYFSDNSKPLIFESETIDSFNTHGTGCTLSSAIAAFLARGLRLEEAVAMAKTISHKP